MAVSHVKSVTIGDFTGTVTAFNSQGSTVTVAATDLARPSDWNSVHNQYFTLTGNTTGGSTASGTNVVFAASGGASIGVSGGNTIYISAPVDVATLSSWMNVPYVTNTQTANPTQSTFHIFPIQPHNLVTCAKIRFLSTISIASSSFASTANTTFSYNQQETHRWVLYSRQTDASSMQLSSVSSGSASLRYSANIGYGSASNTQQQHTFGLTYFDEAGSKTFSTTYSTSNVSTIAISTAAQLTVFTGLQHMDFPFEASLSPGDWWMAVNRSTTFTSQGTNLSGIRVQHSLWGISQVNSAIGEFGVVNAASQQMMLGLGSVTTVGGAVATTINFADISSSASHLLPIVKFGRGLA